MIVIVLYKDMLKKLDDKLNSLLNSSPKEDTTKNDDGSRQTMRSLSQVENKNMGDTSSSNDVTEIQFNSLNDPPRPTSVFDDGYCIYQTPSPSKINDFAPNSRTSSVMDQDGCNSPSRNQYPYPFGYLPVLVPGIVHYSPCWLSSWGGWIASWISWISPRIWPLFLWIWSSSHLQLHDTVTNSVVDIFLLASTHTHPITHPPASPISVFCLLFACGCVFFHVPVFKD